MPAVCPSFLSCFLDNRFRKLLFNPTRILGPHLMEGMTVADIGCGPGFFTIPLAEMVGPGGRVFAVDVQQAMLEKVRRKAAKAGLEERITFHRCGAESLGLPEPLDFALCFWMMHEVPSPERMAGEIGALLRPGGLLLLTEPRHHVRRKRFDIEMAAALKAGFIISGTPGIRGSYSVLLSVPQTQDPRLETRDSKSET